MEPLSLLAGFPLLSGGLVSRRLERVLPVERHGLHLVFDGPGPGLRLDLEPLPGAAVLCRSAPPRVRGGRSAWPDLAAWADRELPGAVAVSLHLSLTPFGVGLALESGCRIALVADRRGGAIVLTAASGESRRLGISEDDLCPVDHRRLARTLRRWAESVPRIGAPAAAEDLLALVPALGRRGSRRVADVAAADPRRLDGWLSWVEDGGSGRLAEALEAIYHLQAASVTDLRHRRALAAAVAARIRRHRRALAALEREERKAADPEQVRRRALALLSAAGRLGPPGADGWVVPDPWNAERSLRIEPPPGVSRPAQAAERLYERARKQERGRERREQRRRQLGAEVEALTRLAAALERAAGRADIEALEQRLEALGITLAAERVSGGGRPARKSGGAPAARVLFSPGGLRILAGRSGEQNDHLTFRVAAPEDLWFHVRGYAGAHVLLQCGGRREIAEADRLFAARLAAAWSQAPRGEKVEVHVARRKHLRRPKGGRPGQVVVRKGQVLLVTAERPPGSE
ncbi:MAG: NFACT family protein [Acidobacteriota bacterium]|nr:NFACT family protein [Acidobacteriota bacterium]MDQ7088527.1 NFACT family protein [Acidobacteriota bacterium]